MSTNKERNTGNTVNGIRIDKYLTDDTNKP